MSFEQLVEFSERRLWSARRNIDESNELIRCSVAQLDKCASRLFVCSHESGLTIPSSPLYGQLLEPIRARARDGRRLKVS